MKLQVLVDNYTYIDHYLYGEPAVSYYIEDCGTKILLDTGYSNVLLKNAELLNINLREVSTIALSHGHNDHTRGLKYLQQTIGLENFTVVAHPDVLKEKVLEGESIGLPLPEQILRWECKLLVTKTPVKISENITFLGEIPQLNSFENRAPIGMQRDKNTWSPDLIKDDTALVYKSAQGLYLITGCSHSGICNIAEYAKQVCKDERIVGIIGGFHLFELTPRLRKTIDYFQQNKIKKIYPCHCISFQAKAEINKIIPIQETGVGLLLEWQ